MTKQRIGLELRSLNNLIRRYFTFASHHEEIASVTGNNGWIIGFIADRADQDVYQRDIEEYLTVTRSTASKVLALMERKDLIQRLPVPCDARLKKVVLTEKGWRIRDLMLQDAARLEATLCEGFTDEELAALVSSLRRMKDNIARQQKSDSTD